MVGASQLAPLHTPCLAQADCNLRHASKSIDFPSGKNVLLVDVRTKEEMEVSMLRGALTK